MADPATQSPYISSSAGGGPSEPGSTPIPAGGRDCKGTSSQSCADSFVSSSQPVSLFSTSQVHDLIFWRDVKKTGFVFGTSLIMLLSLAAFSVISVVSYLILALLSVTISFRVYKSVIQAVQKSEEGHPFKAYLDLDITLSSEAFHNYVNDAMVHVNRALKLIIRLFLVEDLVDSLKLAVVMWLMTYVGAVFNGITLLILGELLIFGIPVVYEKYKTQIDHYVGIIRDQTKSIIAKIQAKLPGMVKKKPE
ncbi:reticulon-3 isoform X2 [Trachemys scripta elegans]|uniref:reticulon-3 isoform X2 n=1 Tax=Trachemys scripta elegans TaxID=31138 RepID=UPI001557F864|nr:reticulon-3 isoform X2 [Trachemys scripta elegans]XP_053890494.1 reticulon-3 isoform X3 [Malaclemys terrapin pileata]